MKYEFHVGDYVEDTDGNKGWICEIENISYAGTDNCVILVEDDSTIMPFTLNDDNVSIFFNRIGQYDFTKPERPKEIERLEESEWPNLYISKVNELVDAVNELRKDKNE